MPYNPGDPWEESRPTKQKTTKEINKNLNKNKTKTLPEAEFWPWKERSARFHEVHYLTIYIWFLHVRLSDTTMICSSVKQTDGVTVCAWTQTVAGTFLALFTIASTTEDL